MAEHDAVELEVARVAGVDLDRLERDALRRWTEITGAPFAPKPAKR